MSTRIVIDAHDFVNFTRSLHGKITLDECERLKDYLVDSQSNLEYIINGILGRDDKPMLQVIIKGELNLSCQRCLGKLSHVLNLKSTLFAGIKEKEYIYLVHSYYAPLCKETVATTQYGLTYSTALQKDNFYGTQFHPEKSSKAGSRLLQNFLAL